MTTEAKSKRRAAELDEMTQTLAALGTMSAHHWHNAMTTDEFGLRVLERQLAERLDDAKTAAVALRQYLED